MKARIPLAIIALLFFVSPSFAQYCGTSGSSVCTPSGTITVAGTFETENLPCVVRGEATSITMQFKNYDFFTFTGTNITINSIRIDSIGDLPSGICWATNKSDNTFLNQEDGCMTFSGTTLAPIGQYKMKLYVTANTNIGIIGPMLDGETVGLKMYLRVKNTPTSICPPIDTNQTNPYDPGANVDSLVYIAGKVYNDANSNGMYDNGEVGLRNIRVNIGNIPALTNAYGNYGAYTEPGTVTVTPQGIESGAISFPGGSQTVNANTAGQEYIGNNFATIISPSHCEASLAVANTGMPPRPGFDNDIRIAVSNTLSQSPLNLTVRVSYNTFQSLVTTSNTPSATGTGYAEFTVSNLGMGATWVSDLKLNSSTSTPLGTLFTYTVQITESSCPAILSQTFTEEVMVVGSYDPNDKAVSPIGYSDHHGINPTQVEKLTYKIRFQNTGTFLAEKVVIVDTISSNLDLTTLQVLSASHNYDVAIGDDRAVKFIFNQIMLPDSNSNEPESHGYVQYSIKLNPSLAQNTQVLNKADIYFDFNEPIRTNTAYNTIDFTTGIKHVEAVYNFNLFPNPTTGNVQVTADEQLVGKQLKVTDISGRVLLERIVDTPVMNMQLSDLANGVYLLQIEGNTKKIVKE